MKILICCYENLNFNGGSAVQVMEFARSLHALGHHVKIQTPRVEKNILFTFDSIDIEYTPVINIRGIRFISYLVCTLFHKFVTVIRYKPDIILLFEIYMDISTLMVATITSTPLLMYVNALVKDELKFPKILFLPLLNLVQLLYCKSSRTLFTISEIIKENLERMYHLDPHKVVLLKNGVNTSLFAPLNKNTSKQSLQLSPKLQYIGFVGTLFPWHGLDYLIEAAPRILTTMPLTRFLIVGSGQTLDYLKDMVKRMSLEKYFIFTGSVPYTHIPLYINACDVCIVFYKPVRIYQGNPMKLYEYLSCGKAVVASNVDDYGIFVEKIGAGLSINSANAHEVAEAIITLLKDSTLRNTMGHAGRSHITQFHSWEQRAKIIEAHAYH